VPISNQVLGYVSDLRHTRLWLHHAGSVVLSPDDPGMMRNTFSHDFTRVHAWDLDWRAQQLAMNSLLHSAMGRKKRRALECGAALGRVRRWLNRRELG